MEYDATLRKLFVLAAILRAAALELLKLLTVLEFSGDAKVKIKPAKTLALFCPRKNPADWVNPADFFGCPNTLRDFEIPADL